MTQTPIELYGQKIKEGLKQDAMQEMAARELERLYQEIMAEKNKPKLTLFQRMAGMAQETPAPKGIYIHGGVGRGKSMLMDMFYACLPDDIKKRRVHFHEFMIEVHDYIHSRQADDSVKGMVDQALPSLADLIARRAHVLCFDEFHVTDITDAMILGRLFKILFEHEVVVVATSNWSPDDLYKDGLQRDRFTPFIGLLKSKVAVVHLDSPNDYRAQTIQIEGTYFSPLNKAAGQSMQHIFEHLTAGQKVGREGVQVKGREIISEQAGGGVARFSFAQLCERPHGAEDYLAIAKKFHTVFLEDVPKLGYDRRNEAKRLMNLIDALYEARVRVIISAATTPEKLYSGSDHAYEFERTISRLKEMQGKDYP